MRTTSPVIAPIIAVTRCARLPDYEASIRAAGGTVRIVDAQGTDPVEVVQSVDGILLTGGDDVDPSCYGETPHPTHTPAEPGRDAFEIALARQALDANRPVLAICRGMQLLNVACAGTLVQDIPDQWPAAINHRVRTPSSALVHEITVSPASLLDRTMGPRESSAPLRVNSRHHQAVKILGTDLVASATAPDGVIEAIEQPAKAFCLGVQWHPENFVRTGEFRTLFEGFISACRRVGHHSKP